MAFQLLVVRGRSSVNRHRLVPGGVTVAGRQDGCQLQIKSSQVSRKHCEFREKDGQLFVKDLNSSNGTFVNGERVNGERVLKQGDELTIGSVKFRVEHAQGAAATASPADTAVPVLAEPGSGTDADAMAFDDSIPLDDDALTSVEPAAPRKAQAEEAQVELEAEATVEELGEDAVAEFLIDLDIEDEDKR